MAETGLSNRQMDRPSALTRTHNDVAYGSLIENDKPLTAACLFSGMGGFASGLARAGFEIRWASDNDEFACATFRHRFPHVRMLEKDVREVSVGSDCLATVDVLTAGFPCQSFSQAGSRRGFEDPVVSENANGARKLESWRRCQNSRRPADAALASKLLIDGLFQKG